MTFAEEIEEVAGGAKHIESVVVGEFGWGAYSSDAEEEAYGWDRDARNPFPKNLRGKPQKWEDVREYLNYDYDRSFGSPECHAIYVYTKTRIILVSTYDGSARLESVPRNPW